MKSAARVLTKTRVLVFLGTLLLGSTFLMPLFMPVAAPGTFKVELNKLKAIGKELNNFHIVHQRWPASLSDMLQASDSLDSETAFFRDPKTGEEKPWIWHPAHNDGPPSVQSPDFISGIRSGYFILGQDGSVSHLRYNE